MQSYKNYRDFSYSFFWCKIPSNFLRMLLVLLLIFSSQNLFAQESDSTKAKKSIRDTWLSRPSTGKTAKTQGTALIALGGAAVVGGIILLNAKDPCERFKSSKTIFCVSNTDADHVAGGIGTVVGIVGIVYGIIRYKEGQRQARAFEEWKSMNLEIK